MSEGQASPAGQLSENHLVMRKAVLRLQVLPDLIRSKNFPDNPPIRFASVEGAILAKSQ